MSKKEKNDILKGLGRYPPGNFHKWHPKGKPRSASEGRLQLDGGFLRNEAIHCYKHKSHWNNLDYSLRELDCLMNFKYSIKNIFK
jgi:hypothetical protein